MIIRNGSETFYGSETSFHVTALGPFTMPAHPCTGIPEDVWTRIGDVETAGMLDDDRGGPQPTPEVQALIAERAAARERRDWAAADTLRDHARALGWEIRDTPSGPEAVPLRQ
jgi:hypothetical protein